MLANTRKRHNIVRVGASSSSVGSSIAIAAILLVGAYAYTSSNVNTQEEWNRRYGGRKS